MRNTKFAVLWCLVNADMWITLCSGAQNLKGIVLDGEELIHNWASREFIKGRLCSFPPALLGLHGNEVCGQPPVCLGWR